MSQFELIFEPFELVKSRDIFHTTKPRAFSLENAFVVVFVLHFQEFEDRAS